MRWMEGLLQSGTIANVILAILAAEALLCVLVMKRLRGMLATLAAGACLVLALRATLLQHSAGEILFFLGLGFVFHVMEIWQWLKMSKSQAT